MKNSKTVFRNLENRLNFTENIAVNGGEADEAAAMKSDKYFWAVTTNNEYLKTVKKAVYNAYPVRTRVPTPSRR